MTSPGGQQLAELSQEVRKIFKQRQSILSFEAFLGLVRNNPKAMMRNASEYLHNCFEHFGIAAESEKIEGQDIRRFKLFDIGTDKGVPIVGGETVQTDVYRCLQAFSRQGLANKVVFLHGPNGSAKSSTIEAISHAMQKYSETEEGAVYRFNWIFPVDRGAAPKSVTGESGAIGFSSRRDEVKPQLESFAMLDDSQIASKLQSEFKENPLYLLPMPFREKLLRDWLSAKEGKRPEDVSIPPHLLLAGLSKRNQMIFENLLAAYDGEIDKVLRHIQVERFFYSRQYRIGISTVEPQMSMDAQEKQLTMDKNIQNLPAFLHNVRFTECFGEIVEANRGILEFSDLLKRPMEAFKYLLTTVERATLGLPSATQHLDIVFFATANEKHLDAFKTSPDFSSFRGRFDLITVPYLLRSSQEEKIYARDVESIRKSKFVAPHAVEVLCLWAVMTRLKHPDPESYEASFKGLVNRLDPFGKARLYDGLPMGEDYSPAEEAAFKQIRSKIRGENIGSVIYEGRFGASPREIKALLYRIAEDPAVPSLTPMAVFAELERLVKDRSVYDFLQFEPRNKYHDAAFFIKNVREYFAKVFESEVLSAMTLVEEKQYDQLLARYIENTVASIKREKIFNRKTEAHEEPSELLMRDIEAILGVSGDAARFRESLLARIGSYRIDNPKAVIDFSVIFGDHLQRIKDHYYEAQSRLIEDNLKAVIALGTDRERDFKEKQREIANTTLRELQRRFGYDEASARECVRFLMMQKGNPTA